MLNANDGVAAAPSAIVVVRSFIVEAAAVEVIPPVAVISPPQLAVLVNVAVLPLTGPEEDTPGNQRATSPNSRAALVETSSNASEQIGRQFGQRRTLPFR